MHVYVFICMRAYRCTCTYVCVVASRLLCTLILRQYLIAFAGLELKMKSTMALNLRYSPCLRLLNSWDYNLGPPDLVLV